MGLFDFFFRPPTIDQFADMFMRELRRTGVTEELTHDKLNGRIIRGTGNEAASINLGNFYREFLALPRGQRKQHVARCVRIMMTPNDMPDDFETARSHLRPKIYARSTLEKSRLQLQIDGNDPDKCDIPEYEIGSHLTASLVYDLPDSMRSIGKDSLEEWGVTYYEALEIARENLEEAGVTLAQIGDGFYASATGDSYDCCRLLLPSLIERLQVKGDLVAMVPSRDSLLVCGTDDEQSLRIMVDLARKANEDPRSLVPIPVRRDGDDWVDWFPAKGHPLFSDFRELAMRYFFQEYADQKELLDQLHEKNGTDIFVASYTVVEKEDGTTFSYAVWTKGVETLLPKVEMVIFGSTDEEDKGTAAIASWERVAQVVGHLIKPTGFYPTRVHITDYPTAAELAELGMATL